MNINSLNFSAIKQNAKNRLNVPYLKPLEYDTVSFGAKLPILKGKVDHSTVNYENPRLDKYTVNKKKYPEASFKKFWKKRMRELKMHPSDFFWNIHMPEDESRFPWKIHLYSDNYRDLEILMDTAGKYLTDNEVIWKALSDRVSFDDLGEGQRSKGITVYPKNQEVFRRIACDLDYIIKINGMKTAGKAIGGDAELGDSGRLFYRFEFRSKKYKDSAERTALDPKFSIDLSDDKQLKMYNWLFYEGNDERTSYYKEFGVKPNGAEYLARDMTVNEDPFRGLDTANVRNNPSVKKIAKDGFIKVKPDSILYLPAYAGTDGKTKYVTIDLNDKKWKKALKKLKDGGALTVGRSGADINFEQEYTRISAKHLRFTKQNGDIYVLDTSKNGTYIQN